MSDVLTKYKRLCLIKELRDVQIIESEFHYAFNRNCDAILRLKIPFPVLRFWNGLVKGGEIVVVSFVDLLKWNIAGNSFVFCRRCRSENNH